MKKGKRILAVIGILFLLSLYLITLICAITDSSGSMQLLFASVVATAIIPVLMWSYSFIYRLLKGQSDAPDTSDSLTKSLDTKENEDA